MKDRKILTSHEVLNLDRRPTLQEMVDLSIEDYTKYLFEKGIIKYIPESGSAYDYEDIPDENNHITYNQLGDPVLSLQADDYYIEIGSRDARQCYWMDNYNLNESKNGDKNKENKIINVNGKTYEYYLDEQHYHYRLKRIS